MARTITQTIRFPKATAAALWALYMDSRKHSTALGSPAKMSSKVGARFSAWDGYITGTNLAVMPKRMVVQSWRASDWGAEDDDSTLILAFRDVKGGAEVDMVHSGVPDDEADALDQGWVDNYWTPWKRVLGPKAKRKSKPRG